MLSSLFFPSQQRELREECHYQNAGRRAVRTEELDGLQGGRAFPSQASVPRHQGPGHSRRGERSAVWCIVKLCCLCVFLIEVLGMINTVEYFIVREITYRIVGDFPLVVLLTPQVSFVFVR